MYITERSDGHPRAVVPGGEPGAREAAAAEVRRGVPVETGTAREVPARARETRGRAAREDAADHVS